MKQIRIHKGHELEDKGDDLYPSNRIVRFIDGRDEITVTFYEHGKGVEVRSSTGALTVHPHVTNVVRVVTSRLG